VLVVGRSTRRQFLLNGARLGAAGFAASVLPFPAFVTHRLAAETGSAFTASERSTLDAALALMIPARGAGDWSAATIGVGDYIEKLLSGTDAIYAGGPTRSEFPTFRPLARAKRIGWEREIARLRKVYRKGIARLDELALGSFVNVGPVLQYAILETVDLSGSEFFAALYAHTMEGAYSHPVYGGNRDYAAWEQVCYQGDVHGVRFPGIGDPAASWNVHGGYAPEEMVAPGTCPGQGPVTDSSGGNEP